MNFTLRKLKVSLLFCVLFLLAACQSNDVKQKSVFNDESLDNQEEREQVSGKDALAKENDINEGKETKPVEEIKEKALYTWNINDQTEVILVEEEGNLEVLQENSALGEAGERQFSGDVAFFIVHENEENGYLQYKLKDVSVNVDRAFSVPHILNDEPFIAWIQPEASNSNTLMMWHYTNGELQRVLFDEEESIIVSSTKLKFLKDAYLQTYVYLNHETDEGGMGWYYTTWKWEEEGRFSTYSKQQYTDDTPYGWESGEHITKLWHEHEEEYVLFPEMTITEEVIDHIKKGQLIEDGVQLGQPIDQVLAMMPDFTAHEYYEGGYYYSFPGPFSYFYDEATREVSFILLSAASITNDLASIKSIFGEPDEDYPNMIDDNHSLLYTIGEKKLRIDYQEGGELGGFWLSQE